MRFQRSGDNGRGEGPCPESRKPQPAHECRAPSRGYALRWNHDYAKTTKVQSWEDPRGTGKDDKVSHRFWSLNFKVILGPRSLKLTKPPRALKWQSADCQLACQLLLTTCQFTLMCCHFSTGVSFTYQLHHYQYVVAKIAEMDFFITYWHFMCDLVVRFCFCWTCLDFWSWSDS